MVEKLLMFGMISEYGVGWDGYAFEFVSFSVVEYLCFFSEEVGNFEYEICFVDGKVFVLFVLLVEVEGLLLESWGCWEVAALFFPKG